jgi:NAD(P)-dependent dehydrogenase (short-subunit alcohol dehydrogenase family)
MFSLSDKVVMITGAAGNLGQAVTRIVQELGGKTLLVERSREHLEKAFGDLASSKKHWLADDTDLTDPASTQRMVDEAHGRFGRIDGLVNTVGAFRGGKPVHEGDLGDWDFLYDVNVRTALNACRAVVPHMLKSGQGRIIAIASRNAFQGSPKYAAYSAAKAAVLRLTESLSGELKHGGITANCIVPGTIDTPQNRSSMPNADHSTWVAPEQIANVIAFLLSTEAGAVTGAAIPVYGRT